MLLQSPRAYCKAPGGAGSIWKYLEALVRATGVPGRFASGFRNELHFADDLVNSEMHLEAEIDSVGRYTWRPCSIKTGEVHGGGRSGGVTEAEIIFIG